MAIPVLLFWFIRKRSDLPFPRVFWMFCAFIVLCGLTHASEILMTAVPLYRVSALVKVATAAVSLMTAAMLRPLIPQALALRSPAELERVNRALAAEVQERQRAQEAILDLNRTLEARIEERSRALREAEEELLQARKMEAVGRLAGGIAHDFNNLLQVINGYSSLAIGAIPPGGPGHDYVREVGEAGQRAAKLTRQLLAFSRKQVLQPRRIDLNQVVRGMETLLRQIIGEDIAICVSLDSDLAPVLVDPGQIEQVIVNLAANARDAMPAGGELWISTARVELDETYTREYLRMKGGAYVRLEVSDTGSGMDPATLGRIFEPFYTTKAPGKGTGLGLATVHGIVNQSGGHISCTSRPGEGATFRIHFPAAAGDDAAPASARRTAPSASAKGSETILVVEDNPDVRRLVSTVLRETGYRILEAEDPEQGLKVIGQGLEHVDLLVSDIVMPGMSGPELHLRLRALRPDLRVLFMSGYARSAVDRLPLAPGAPLLEKPFAPDQLTMEVRRILDAPVA
jgi:two-component system, cell cycle sensor histidine kinase and response regulator CckA